MLSNKINNRLFEITYYNWNPPPIERNLMLETFAGARRQILEAFPGIGMRVWGNEDSSEIYFAICHEEQIDYRTFGSMWRAQFENTDFLSQRISNLRNILALISKMPTHTDN